MGRQRVLVGDTQVVVAATSSLQLAGVGRVGWR